MQDEGSADGIRRLGREEPLRGTQSLVGVLAFVWKHPALTLCEVAWRWIAAAPLVWLAWRRVLPLLGTVPVDHEGLANLSLFEPVHSAAVLVAQAQRYLPALRHAALWWVPLAIALWVTAATVGRTVVLRRAEPALHAALGRSALANFGRAVGFLALLALTLWGGAQAVQLTIIAPAQSGREPSVVLLTAALVALSLAAFALWSLLVWKLDLAALEAMTSLAPPRGAPARELRAKLVETNLVMGIVRVALLVLAMTFSASPLPFQTQETQSYITAWWIGVALLYLLGSDFFHVVRRVTYLRLLQSIANRSQNRPAAVC